MFLARLHDILQMNILDFLMNIKHIQQDFQFLLRHCIWVFEELIRSLIYQIVLLKFTGDRDMRSSRILEVEMGLF